MRPCRAARTAGQGTAPGAAAAPSAWGQLLEMHLVKLAVIYRVSACCRGGRAAPISCSKFFFFPLNQVCSFSKASMGKPPTFRVVTHDHAAASIPRPAQQSLS